MNKKRICFIVNVDWFYLSHRKALADMFVNSNFIVSVIAGKSQENKLENLTTFDIKSRIPTLLGFIKILKKILTDERKSIFIVVSPVMIFCFHFFFFFKKFAYYNFSGFGFIRSISSKKQNILFKTMNYMPFCGNRVIVVQNRSDYKFLKDKINSSKIKIRLIPGSGFENKNISVNKFNSPLTVGYVGRIRKDKGILTLIKAVNQMKQDNHPLNLVIWGELDFEGGHQFSSKELDYINENKSYFKGFSSSKSEIFSSFDIFCLPSSGEGLSKAAIEASSYGKILLLSDVPGNSDMVNKNGYLFKYDNVEDLKLKLIILISSNISTLKHLSQTSILHFKINWSLEKIYENWKRNINKDLKI